MLKYLWEATFEDGHRIVQPVDDRYSKHDDTAEYNPSAFRDILEYQEVSPLKLFSLVGHDNQVHTLNIKTGEFFINGTMILLDQPLEELSDRKLIYYRTRRADLITREQYIKAYNFGYEGKHPESGKIVKKVITIT